MPSLKTAGLDLYRLVFLTTGQLSNSEDPMLMLGQPLPASPPLLCVLSVSSLSFLFDTFSLSPPTPPPPSTVHGGGKGLIPSGQGTGKAKCLPSPQAPAGKEGQAPQNRKAGALGGGHIRAGSQKAEL